MVHHASIKNDPTAEYIIGLIYYSGDTTLPANKAKGIEHLKKAAKLGLPQAKKFLQQINVDSSPYPHKDNK